MRADWSHLDEFRVVDGPYRSSKGERQGAFWLFCPETGRKLLVLASSGVDWQEAGLPGDPWEHVSVSLAERGRRCPAWPEMDWVKRQFFDDEECVIQYHPPADAKINLHAGCLHLWKPTGAVVPMPPELCV